MAQLREATREAPEVPAGYHRQVPQLRPDREAGLSGGYHRQVAQLREAAREAPEVPAWYHRQVSELFPDREAGLPGRDRRPVAELQAGAEAGRVPFRLRL